MSTPDLPTGYTELEYLESSGTQCINLNITVDDKTTLRGFVVANMDEVNYTLFGSQYPEYRLVLNGRKDLVLVIINTSTGRYVFTPPASGEIRFEFSPGSCSVNGSTQSTVLYPALSNISLFRAYGSLEYFSYAKFYNFEAEAAGVKVLSLIPALNKDGVPGMWDKVSGDFFKNDGSGTFGYKIKNSDIVVAPE